MTNNKENQPHKKTSEVVSGNRKLQDIKLIQQKSFYFYVPTMEKSDLKEKNTIYMST